MDNPLAIAAAPFIFNLDDDLLLFIFHLNTHRLETEYPFYDGLIVPCNMRTINIARYTSQVCHSWRQLILGSPTIWGSLIDLTIADTSAAEWVGEVMKRSGGAYLSIYGSIEKPRALSFFISLLSNHWHRVRTLDVNYFRTPFTILATVPWDIFWTGRAPNLEKFVLKGGQIPEEPASDLMKSPIFSDSAPALRRYHCPAFFPNPNPKASWVSQLLSVTLSGPLVVSDGLNIISNTFQLESLTILHTKLDVQAMGWTKKIHLPNLIRIDINGTIQGSLVYLEHIVRNPGCALILTTSSNDKAISAGQLVNYIKTTISYTESYFEIHKPDAMRLIAREDRLSLYCKPRDTSMVYFGRPMLSLYTGLEWHGPQGATLSMYPFFRALLSVPFQSIRQLDVEIGADLQTDTNYPDFLKFISSFSSVQTLEASIKTMKVVHNILLNCMFALPSLRYVDLPNNADQPQITPDDVIPFLSLRNTARVPIKRLGIPNFGILKQQDDWSFLDKFEGLIIYWDEGGVLNEYRFGSGGT